MRTYSSKKVKIQSVLFLLASVFIVAACGSKQEESAMFNMPAQETNFTVLKRTNATITHTYPGKIEGAVNVDIKAQVSGYLEEIYVKEGAYVQKGQALFRIKGDVFKEQVNNSDAALKSALANLATATLEVDKLKPLVEGKVISAIQLNEAKARYEAAVAQVAQAKAGLGSSKLNADFALIKAPVSGYISGIPSRIGNLVTPNDAIPLTTLSDINAVFVYFSFSEADYIAYKKANQAEETIELILADGSVYPLKGKLEFASGNINRNTGSMTLKAIFENPEQLLRSGGTGRVMIHRLENNVLKVSKLQVKDIQDKHFVFKLLENNTVAMTPIEVVGSAGDDYLVQAGVQAGDKIASNRMDALMEGMEVIPLVSESVSSK